ncbi:hypothetical protein BST23_06080 [Mycolicibacterium elephantis]|uniref:Uncharacterized protein n=1 Tax=Mycolicibacterium elephantis TaxID=81858 RepID=A0A0M2ZFD4_9MYCO|nr:hypothetical protein AAV95_12960 [Mycolicibacterium elephantis]OBE95780.1 hypothetical protein A5776_20905 [Mycolicibacterium elephantis]ORA67934.1 hypothetical protein BST23_06080 [Mycolicibacterium elephantis]
MTGDATAGQGERLRRARPILLLTVLAVGLALLLTRCPAYRDGMPGRLAQAMEETTSAARSGVVALDLWTQGRSTTQLASVQITDARDDVAKAYNGIVVLRAQDPVDVRRQRMLTESMTAIIAELNAASAVLRDVDEQPGVAEVRAELARSSHELEAGYR